MHMPGLCGSLRGRSYNRRLLAAAARELPDEAVFLVCEDIDAILPYGDIDTRDTSVAVQALRAAIAAAKLS
jgi:NAD(P)H-dependent FMN reductase